MRAPTASMKVSCWFADPWCGTLSTSARRSVPDARSACWAAGSTSPVSSSLTPRTSTARTTLALLGSDPWPRMTRSGPTTRQVTSPTVPDMPTDATPTGTPRSPDQRATAAACSSGSASGLVSTWPTGRSAQRTGQPRHVVGVVVGEDQQRYLPDAEMVQAAVQRGRVGANVDDHGVARAGGQHQRVPLPDVTGDRNPAGGWPAQRADDQRSEQGDDAGGGHQPNRRWPTKQPPQRQGAAAERRERGDGTQPPVGPGRRRHRPVGRVAGHGADPAGRNAAQPGQPASDRGCERRHDGGPDAEDRRRGHRRRCQQVRRHADQRHLPRQRHRERQRRHLGGQRHRTGLRDRPGQPAGPVLPPARRQREQPGRGGYRQREPPGPRQPGVDEEQPDHGRQERRRPRTPTPDHDRQHRDRPHDRGPQHARLGPGQDDERGGGQQRHCGDGHPSDPHPPGQQQHRHRDDRDVGPGDGRQVGQAAHPQVGHQVVAETGGVAHDERGQQAPWVRRQPCGGRPQPRPHRLRASQQG